MIPGLGAIVGMVFGAGTAMATFVTTALTVAGTLFSLNNMFEGISEGDIGKAVLGGIGSFTGIQSLQGLAGAGASTASVASTSTDTSTFSDASYVQDLSSQYPDAFIKSGDMVDMAPVTEGVTEMSMTEALAPLKQA